MKNSINFSDCDQAVRKYLEAVRKKTEADTELHSVRHAIYSQPSRGISREETRRQERLVEPFQTAFEQACTHLEKNKQQILELRGRLADQLKSVQQEFAMFAPYRLSVREPATAAELLLWVETKMREQGIC